MNSLKVENIKNRFVAETHQYEPDDIENYWKDVMIGLNDAAKTVLLRIMK